MAVNLNKSAIVIGCSAGGLQALGTLLPAFDKDMPVPLAVVQHMASDAGDSWIKRLDRKCQIRVSEAILQTKLESGNAYIAPPGYHLQIEPDHTFSYSNEERVKGSRPSIDVLFETAADVYHKKLIGVVLTGANSDGANGLRYIKRRGGTAIVQDPQTAYVDTMPRAAIEACEVDYILQLEKIGSFLNNLCKKL